MHDRGRKEQVPLHPGDVQGQDPERGPVAPGQGDNSGDKNINVHLIYSKVTNVFRLRIWRAVLNTTLIRETARYL